MTDTRPSWDEYFLQIAETAASRSNCSRRKIGAIIVKDKAIISTGYNGTPKGITNCFEGGCARCASDCPSGEDLDKCICGHAEANAIVQAACTGASTKDTTMYCTHAPCLNCTKLIINAGVSKVIYKNEYPSELASDLLRRAGIWTISI